MFDNEYPALFLTADKASINCQKNFMILMKWYIILLIIASILSFIGINSVISSIFSAILFLSTIGISIFIIIQEYQRKWYNLRAIAESVKTLSWRYMMCAEPFSKGISSKKDKIKFANTLALMLKQNKIDAEEFSGHYDAEEQLTEKMHIIHESDLQTRKDIYLNSRIKQQRKWYSEKTVKNQRGYKQWFSLMIVVQAIAVITVLLRIAFPKYNIFPTEVLAVCACGILTWLQTQKYKELSAAYSLASLEIGTLQSCISEITEENDFSEFVIESENAFSREHTQWVVKRI